MGQIDLLARGTEVEANHPVDLILCFLGTEIFEGFDQAFPRLGTGTLQVFR